MNKEELLKLLQDEETAGTILNLVNSGAVKKQKDQNAKEAAAQKKLDREAEKKSSLSMNMIDKLRSKVESAAAKEREYTPPGISSEPAQSEDLERSEAEFPEFEGLSVTFADDEEVAKETKKPPSALASKLDKLRSHVQSQNKPISNEPSKTEIVARPKQESDYRLVLKRTCPVCGKESRVIKYKSRLPVVSYDVDLCIRYQGINPYIYSVMACEYCGFAAEESKFISKLPNRHRESLAEFLADGEMVMPFSEERTVEEAAQITEIAVLFCEMTDRSASRRANLLMKIAWIYRYAENKEQEKIYLEKAAEMYEESLKTERAYAGHITGNTIVYLLSAIYFLTGHYSKSISNLSRLVSDLNLKTQEPRIYDRARALWQDIRLLQKSGEIKNG